MITLLFFFFMRPKVRLSTFLPIFAGFLADFIILPGNLPRISPGTSLLNLRNIDLVWPYHGKGMVLGILRDNLCIPRALLLPDALACVKNGTGEPGRERLPVGLPSPHRNLSNAHPRHMPDLRRAAFRSGECLYPPRRHSPRPSDPLPHLARLDSSGSEAEGSRRCLHRIDPLHSLGFLDSDAILRVSRFHFEDIPMPFPRYLNAF